jgi:hypothetical protein
MRIDARRHTNTGPIPARDIIRKGRPYVSPPKEVFQPHSTHSQRLPCLASHQPNPEYGRLLRNVADPVKKSTEYAQNCTENCRPKCMYIDSKSCYIERALV